MKSGVLAKRTKRKSNNAGPRTLDEKVEPLARDVSFFGEALEVFLADGRKISAPLEWFPRLRQATPKQRSNWQLIGEGVAIHWPEVDEDIEVGSLLAI